MSSLPDLKKSKGYYDYILKVPPRFNDTGDVSLTEAEARSLYEDLKKEFES